MDDILKKRLQILGLRIAYFRKRRGLTQEQLADKVGKSWSYLAKIEANNSDTPHAISLEYLFAISDVLGISVSRLFDDLD